VTAWWALAAWLTVAGPTGVLVGRCIRYGREGSTS
jgi:hypothetical protein